MPGGLVCEDVVTGADCIGVVAARVTGGVLGAAAGVLTGADPDGTGSAGLAVGVTGFGLA